MAMRLEVEDVLGILGPNSLVENTEIIYDARCSRTAASFCMTPALESTQYFFAALKGGGLCNGGASH